jgi:hypothetical protein
MAWDGVRGRMNSCSYEYGTGKEIHEKVIRAYNKEENFTGIIRLNIIEKDFYPIVLNEREVRGVKEFEKLKRA